MLFRNALSQCSLTLLFHYTLSLCSSQWSFTMLVGLRGSWWHLEARGFVVVSMNCVYCARWCARFCVGYLRRLQQEQRCLHLRGLVWTRYRSASASWLSCCFDSASASFHFSQPLINSLCRHEPLQLFCWPSGVAWQTHRRWRTPHFSHF